MVLAPQVLKHPGGSEPPVLTSWEVWVRLPEDWDAATFLEFMPPEINNTIARDAAGKNVTWPSRGWDSKPQFQTMLTQGLSTDGEGMDAQQQTETQAQELATRLFTAAQVTATIKVRVAAVLTVVPGLTAHDCSI